MSMRKIAERIAHDKKVNAERNGEVPEDGTDDVVTDNVITEEESVDPVVETEEEVS